MHYAKVTNCCRDVQQSLNEAPAQHVFSLTGNKQSHGSSSVVCPMHSIPARCEKPCTVDENTGVRTCSDEGTYVCRAKYPETIEISSRQEDALYLNEGYLRRAPSSLSFASLPNTLEKLGTRSLGDLGGTNTAVLHPAQVAMLTADSLISLQR